MNPAKSKSKHPDLVLIGNSMWSRREVIEKEISPLKK